MSNPDAEGQLTAPDSWSPPVIIITPDNRRYVPDFQELWDFRHLLYALVWRNIRVRYRNSALGAVWIALQPLLRMLIYTLIFGLWARIPVGDLPYSIHVLSGLVLVFFLNRIIAESANAVRANQSLTRKVYFPKLILPCVLTISSLTDLCVALVLLLVIMAIQGVFPNATVLLAPLFLLALLGWGFTLGIWLTALGIRFVDIVQVTPILTTLMMFMSPIIYPITMVPESLLPIYALNPMVGIVTGFRWAVLGIEPFYAWTIVLSVGETLILGLTGMLYFVRTERNFNDYL
jgi:lipopolysaccharide transport system permease protein